MIDTASNLLASYSSSLEHGTEELCGVVMPNGDLVRLDNIHAQPTKGFHMEPLTFLSAVQAGAVGTWHTHPGMDPNLSEEDRVGFMQWPQLIHHILGIRDGVPTVHSFKVADGVLVTA